MYTVDSLTDYQLRLIRVALLNERTALLESAQYHQHTNLALAEALSEEADDLSALISTFSQETTLPF